MELEQALSAVERQMSDVSAALLAADALALERSSVLLRQAAMDLSQIMGRLPAPQTALTAEIRQRIRDIGTNLAMQRDGLARLSAVTDRQVAVFLPPSSAAPTYGQGAGRRTAAAAGRLYRAAG